MANRPGSSFMKRQKERARQEKQREKFERRRQKKLETKNTPPEGDDLQNLQPEEQNDFPPAPPEQE
jgi:hypothetical protein